jgi:hypothetical protein
MNWSTTSCLPNFASFLFILRWNVLKHQILNWLQKCFEFRLRLLQVLLIDFRFEALDQILVVALVRVSSEFLELVIIKDINNLVFFQLKLYLNYRLVNFSFYMKLLKSLPICLMRRTTSWLKRVTMIQVELLIRNLPSLGSILSFQDEANPETSLAVFFTLDASVVSFLLKIKWWGVKWSKFINRNLPFIFIA